MERKASNLSHSESGPNTKELWFWRAAVLAGLSITLYFGLVKELERGVWHDEALSTFFISLNWGELFSLMAQYEANMGLYYVLLKAWSTLSTSEIWLRLFSLSSHIATGILLYYGARRYLGVRPAHFFLILFLSHYLLVRYSVEIRGYALATLFIALLWSVWMRLVAEKDHRWWPAYAAIGATAVHTHLLVSVALLFFGLSLLFTVKTRRDIIRWITCHLLVVLSFTPLLFFVLTKESGQLGWISTPTIRSLVYSLFDIAGASGKARNLVRYSTFILVFGVFPLTLLFYIAKLENIKLKLFIHNNPALIATLSGLALPLLVIFAVFSLSQIEPAFSTRFFIPYIPLLMLAVAATANIGLRYLAVFMPLPFLFVASTLVYSERPNTGWRKAYEVIENRCEHTDAIIYITPAGQAASEFYKGQSTSGCDSPIFPYHLNANTYLDDYKLQLADWSTLQDIDNLLVVLSHTNYTLDDIIDYYKNLNGKRLVCNTVYLNASITAHECEAKAIH